jgi:hypothetical protein
LARTSVTALCYAGGLGMGTLALDTRPAAVRAGWLAWASTNLANLAHHPVGALLASAFVIDENPAAWIVFALIGLVCASRVLGNVRTAVLVASVHVLATGISEAILAYRIHTADAPPADRHILDVGPSYIVIAALAVAVAYGTWPGRLASGTAFILLAPHLFGGLPRWEVSSVGHACTVIVAPGLGYLLGRCRRPHP